MVVHILSQPCSSSFCERIWSVFEHMHSKKRNRLTQEWMNDLVFVHHNLQLKIKKTQGTIEEDEPIDLDEIDPESELIAVDDDTLLELEDFDLMGEAGLDCEWIE
ncbi:uncharacterized protein LOC131076113 [Cryptomeria japonica]|uniref:uncharacterized protein LOC131076113 n=1 Tax=Cryptomeria japonica TaxID=3369 RepID=UPI0025AB84F9|nr:uncharacterized protein LOC131076113 [Cryptomeria japonica]